MALKRNKPEFTLLRGAVPKPADTPASAPAPAVPATQNSLSPTTVIYWGYWKSVGDIIATPGATASTSTVTGVTAAAAPTENTSTTTDQAALQKSQGSFLYKIAPTGATA